MLRFYPGTYTTRTYMNLLAIAERSSDEIMNLFFQCCITVDTVCALLATAERYIQYKCTKFLIQKVKNSNKTIYLSLNLNHIVYTPLLYDKIIF